MVGIDEAGLGPNLGPFVVVATVWQIDGPATTCDLWATFPELFTADPNDGTERLPLVDSKALYQPSTGLARLEQTVLGLLGGWGSLPTTLTELHARVQAPEFTEAREPWLQAALPQLPLAATPTAVSATVERVRATVTAAPCRLAAVSAVVQQPYEFNQSLARTGNKAATTSDGHRQALAAALAAVGDEPTAVFSDKHGGRNFYAGFLSELRPGAWVQTRAEGATSSRYRVDQIDFTFEPRAERYAPVAVASMIAKLLRELHMHAFNQFWQTHIPSLKPTAGYPQDAKRFAREIEQTRAQLGIDQSVLWRTK